MLESFVRDARHAARSLARSPVFALTAALSLAIGIGATTAMFTFADTLLFKPPAGIGTPDRLVNLGRTQDGAGFDTFSYPNLRDYRDQSSTLAGLAEVQLEPRSLSLAGPQGGEAVQGSMVGGSFFDVLQARPALGRFFLPEEDRVPGTHAVVVISHRFWRQRFNADPDIAGRGIVLNGSPFTIIGVTEEKFHGPFVVMPDLWAPMMATPLLGSPESLLTGRRNVWLIAVARLKPDVGLGEAQAELSTIASRLEQAYPEANRGQGIRVQPASLIPGDLDGIVGAFLAFLLALSALVLAVAGTNVAGMLLARAATRRREVAVRLALGASRSRLVRQFVTESVLLFLLAGGAGVLLARWLMAGLMALVPRLPVQLGVEPAIDWRVLVFAVLISLVAGLLAGLAPALQSTRPALAPELRSDAGGTRQRHRLRSVLLVAQMAFSMLLLVTAGLFARALVEARAIDPGFDPREVHVASLDLRLANYEEDRGLPLADALLERVRGLPGVESAALSAMLPLDGGGLGLGAIDVPGREPPDPRRGWAADWNVVTPDYFDVMRIPMIRGRAFTDADRSGTPDVAIINQALAERIWPGQEAVGRTFRNENRTVTVIGVARDAKYRSLGEAQRGFVYVPLAQRYFTRTSLLVRTVPGGAAPPIRPIVAELEPALPILIQRTLTEQVAIGLFPQRVALWVAGSLGTVALLLAVLGIYGVTAFGVTQRTREIGIRMALGAQRALVVRQVLRQGVRLAAFGILAGVAAALAVTRLLASLLYGVSASDPIAVLGAAALLVVAALAASWLPARRAAGVDPATALRAD